MRESCFEGQHECDAGADVKEGHHVQLVGDLNGAGGNAGGKKRPGIDRRKGGGGGGQHLPLVVKVKPERRPDRGTDCAGRAGRTSYCNLAVL